MTNYQHCLTIAQSVLPDKDWDEIWETWRDFESMDHGDNEPFSLIREAMAKLIMKEHGK